MGQKEGMELAAHWHRCQNLQKTSVYFLSAVYRWRDDPVKKGKSLNVIE
jgi:hypothetical protein